MLASEGLASLFLEVTLQMGLHTFSDVCNRSKGEGSQMIFHFFATPHKIVIVATTLRPVHAQVCRLF